MASTRHSSAAWRASRRLLADAPTLRFVPARQDHLGIIAPQAGLAAAALSPPSSTKDARVSTDTSVTAASNAVTSPYIEIHHRELTTRGGADIAAGLVLVAYSIREGRDHLKPRPAPVAQTTTSCGWVH